MADDPVQTYANHVRLLPLWHFFVIPILGINAIVQIVALAQRPALSSLWEAVVAIALVVGLILARWMPLRVQDRLIRLEEKSRLERVLPGRHGDVERLTTAHFIGLRFASNAELPHLVDRILSGEISSRDDVKRAVQHWRSDHHRI